jgi:hypothetical protein
MERRESINKVYKSAIDPLLLARKMAMVNMHERIEYYKEYYKYSQLLDIRDNNTENRFEFDFKILYELFKNTNICKIVLPSKEDLTTKNDLIKELEAA